MVGEDNEMGGGERVGRLIGRLKNIGLTIEPFYSSKKLDMV